MQNQISNISPNHPITSSPSEARLPWLDFASGIMILWMIVYHAIQASWCYEVRDLWGITDASLLPEGIHAFINSDGKLEVLNPCVVFPWLHFFMPWFFYKSGQFFKKQCTEELWKKDSKKLIKTFVIWSLVSYVFFLVFGWLNNSLTFRSATYSVVRALFLRGFIPINCPLWFLLTLFGVRFVANQLLPKRDDNNVCLKIVALVLTSYVVSYLTFRFNHRLLPYWIANGTSGLCFFMLGYALRDWEKKWWVILTSVSICLVSYIIDCPAIVDMFNNSLLLGKYLLWIPISLSCIISFNFICRVFNKHARVRIIENIGCNAMTILVTHCLIYATISQILSHLTINLPYLIVLGIIVFSYIIILPICCFLKNKIFTKV